MAVKIISFLVVLAAIAVYIWVPELIFMDEVVFVDLYNSHPYVFITGVLVLLFVCYKVFMPRKKCEVFLGGHVQPGWEAVKETFRKNLESGLENGGTFSVYHEGSLVVNLWGGYADKEAGQRLWTDDTMTCAFSATKGVYGICMALLVDRKLLSYDDPVCKYWPEFAQKGKDKITVAMILCHRAGISVVDNEEFHVSLIKENPKEVARILAAQEPNFPPDTAQAYSPMMASLCIDQLIRRVDPKHRSLGDFFHQEIAQPFDIDFYIGLPKEMHYRMTRNQKDGVKFPPWQFWKFLWYEIMDKDSLGRRMSGKPKGLENGFSNNPYCNEIEIGGFNGFGTSLALAKLYGILANGGKEGRRKLLSQEAIDNLQKLISCDEDKVLRMKIPWSYGTGVFNIVEGDQKHLMFGTAGMGGQMTFGDSHYKLGFAYITNYHNLYHGFIIDARYIALQDSMYECVQKLKGKTVQSVSMEIPEE